MPGRLRRITVYETASRFYLVGCDPSGSRYNVLKIDRVDSKVLLTGEPDSSYTREEILELLATISEGNSVVLRSSTGKKPNSKGLIERVSSSHGILGVVRFLEGYYLIVITKATEVATFGYHSIYKVAEVAMISIAMDGVSSSAEEQRYVRQFQSVDLSTDFYFSYTYDLSRTLQENTLALDKNGFGIHKADSKFIWNSFLLEPFRNNCIGERWFVEIVHGYVNQQIIDLPCNKLSLTLIGRRSAVYAGTRFLKRGANLQGSVANDVETEQILWDVLSSPSFSRGKYSSFSQRRGSVPLRWSQDPATRGVVGKPLILIDIHEPHAQTAAAHFRELRKKYGSPIVVMNLVKRREKRRHESLLHDQFLKAIRYLNIFLPDDEKICYLSFDVARCNKSSTVASNVLTKLDEIAMKAVQKHGWFQTFPVPYSHVICPRGSLSDFTPSYSEDGRFLIQKGVSRTNCVDCLDRTNVAQFAIGRAALACQLFSMGVLDAPYLSLQSEFSRVFEEMFDAHGDTLALQYAGSQLVHSIKTYKKTAAFQERSRDVIQTISRYYSNTFADYDKQAAINLFLGVFRPKISSLMHLWDLPSDYYLHFPNTSKINMEYCAWMFEPDELAKAICQENEDSEEKEVNEDSEDKINMNKVISTTAEEEFNNFYKTYEMTTLEPKVRTLVISDQKALSVGGINQDIITSGQFMKLFKSDTKDTKQPVSKKISKDSEDDEEEGEEERKEDVLEVEEPWLTLTRSEEKNKRERDVHDRRRGKQNILASGLQFAKDIYGLQHASTNVKREMTLFNNYVLKGAFKVDEADWQRLKPTLLTDLKIPEAQPRLWRSSIFNTDDVFQCGDRLVSDAAINFYTKTCDTTRLLTTSKVPSKFTEYPAIY